MILPLRSLLRCIRANVGWHRIRPACAGPTLVLLLGLIAPPSSAFAQQDCAPQQVNGAAAATVARTGTAQPHVEAARCDTTAALARAHARGGWRLAVVLGDSADHLRHNAVNVAALSTALIAFLWTLPEDFPNFYTRDPSFSDFAAAYTRPPLWNDGDWWFWNWVAHPLVGMQEYLMERNWGSSQLKSFLFATAASLAWEYGFEAWMERPSVQDMLLTSPVGWLLGEAVYRLTQQLRRNGFSAPEKFAVLILNPLYVLQHGFR